MNILFLGTPEFAVPSLEVVKDKITGVVTHPDRPAGRHLKVSSPSVKITAQKYNLPVYQPERVSSPEFINELKKMSVDLIITVAFGEILSEEVLNIPKLGSINLHASLLPKYRGAAPIAWALINGEKITGVTTFWLNECMDKGDIIMQKEIDILPDDTRGTLEKRLAEAGSELLLETINSGTKIMIPQDETKATYAPKLKKEDGKIDWAENAVTIHNKIRAMNPWPGAYTFFKNKRLEVWTSSVVAEGSGQSSPKSKERDKPGTVVLLNKDGIGVATGGGMLLIKELQIEGKKRTKAEDFVRGYRINEGVKF